MCLVFLIYCKNAHFMAVWTGINTNRLMPENRIFSFGVHPCSASQSLTAEWPRSWSGTAASGLGISYFCATMIPLRYSHKISASVADLNGITKGKRRWAEIPSFRDERAQCGASVNVKLRWSITLNQLDWTVLGVQRRLVWFTALWW